VELVVAKMRVVSKQGLVFELSRDAEQLIASFAAGSNALAVGIFSHLIGDRIAYGIGGYRQDQVEEFDSFDLQAGSIWLVLSEKAIAKLAGATLIAVGRQLQVEQARTP
jgi:hypothetical protein